MTCEFNFFGVEAKFHHVGLAVNSLKNISLESEIFTDEIQKVRVAFASLNGLNIELIEPLNNASPIKENMQKGVKLVHICYEVTDIDKQLKECKKYGFYSIAKPVPATAFGNRKIAWVFSKVYGLFELLEKKQGK